MPGFEKSGWFEVLAYTCAKSTGCLCSYFTVNLMVSVPVPFSRELLYRQTHTRTPPSGGDAGGVWVVMDFCWTFECVNNPASLGKYYM